MASGSIQKRTGKRGVTWSVVLDLPRDPITGQRRQKRISAPTRKEVERLALEARHAMARGAYIEPSTITLGDYLNEWLARTASERRGSTDERHERDIRLHLIPGLGAIRLRDLTPLHIQGFIDQKKETLAASTVRRSYCVLHNALDQAIRWRLLDHNPCAGVSLPRTRTVEMRVWDEAQVQCFLTATADDPHAALWRLAVLVGLRKGELLALQWRDIDFARQHLLIRRTQTRDRERRLTLGEPKTRAGRRTIKLPALCVDALRAHRDRETFMRGTLADDAFVSPDTRGGMLHADAPNIMLARHIRMTGLPRIRFHDLRHTAATLMLLQGVSPRVVQERLGHASLVMTLGLYSHVTLTMQEDAADKMDRMFREA